MSSTLGQLKIINDLRKVWPHEEYDFTPWLHENIALLVDQLDLEFDLEDREVQVGTFTADLVGTERNTGRRVVIENQLEATDHSHLGQLLTYAAGLEATVVVWVAKEFREEHRAAIEWLNHNTRQGVDFFAVEVALLQINESPLAPHFKLVASPNQWYKETMETAAVVSGKNDRYRRFYNELLTKFHQQHPNLIGPKSGYAQSWMPTSVGRSGIELNWAFSGDGKFRVELYIHNNKQWFDQLEESRSVIEGHLGDPLVWERLDLKKAARISIARDGSVDDESAWPELHTWGIKEYIRMRAAFAPLVKKLS